MKDNLNLESQLCFRLYNLTKSMNRLYAPVLKALNLTYPQYLVMLALWQEKSAISVKLLGQKLDLDSGTLSPLLQRMERQDLVIKNKSKTDERSVEIHLTKYGASLKKEAQHIPEQMFKATKLSVDELINLTQTLDTLQKNIGETN